MLRQHPIVLNSRMSDVCFVLAANTQAQRLVRAFCPQYLHFSISAGSVTESPRFVSPVLSLRRIALRVAQRPRDVRVVAAEVLLLVCCKGVLLQLSKLLRG